MKKLFFAGIGLAMVACQPQASQPPTRAVQVKLLPKSAWATPDTLPPLPVRYSQLTKKIVPSQPVTDSLAVRRFFAQHDLSTLLELPGSDKNSRALEGFRGADKYRTEVAVLTARRSAANPAIYLLRGLTRTRQRIAHFSGQLVFSVLNKEPLLTAEEKATIKNFSMISIISTVDNEPVKRYSVAGRVALTENAGRSDASAFAGSVVLEIGLTKAGNLLENAPFLEGPSQGGRQKYAGTWTALQTNHAEPAVWVADIVGYSPHVFSDLIIGERDVAINPRYAKLGWNKMWENDEWWATSPKPSLSL